MVQARQIAYNVWIGDLINGQYVKKEGEWEPNYIVVGNKNVSRVNLIVSVVTKFSRDDGGYVSLDLDDSSGIIRAKMWDDDVRLFDHINVGDLVLVIGRPKKYNDELYLIPEIIRVLDDIVWAKIRKLELEQEYGKPTVVREEIVPLSAQVEEEVGNQSDRQKILGFVGKYEEVEYDSIARKLRMDEKKVENIIKELIKEGEIYTPRANILKAI